MLRSDLFDVIHELARRKHTRGRESIAVTSDDAAPKRESSARAFTYAERDRVTLRAESVADAKHFARLAEAGFSWNQDHHVADDPPVEGCVPIGATGRRAIVAIGFDLRKPEDLLSFRGVLLASACVRVVALRAEIEALRTVVAANRANEPHRG